jgi:hypothetical protein
MTDARLSAIRGGLSVTPSLMDRAKPTTPVRHADRDRLLNEGDARHNFEMNDAKHRSRTGKDRTERQKLTSSRRLTEQFRKMASLCERISGVMNRDPRA